MEYGHTGIGILLEWFQDLMIISLDSSNPMLAGWAQIRFHFGSNNLELLTVDNAGH